MQTGIHPNYREIVVTCSCGNTFKTHSTFNKTEMHLDVCSNCHPFYTGKTKIVDTGGRVDKYNKRFSAMNIQEQRQVQPSTKPKSGEKAKTGAKAKTTDKNK